MENINNILNKFQPISLKELDKVKLLNRTDTKYVLPIICLPEILKEIIENYYILDIDNKRLFAYETLYFDTDNLRMFIAHHNGKLNRYKIRKREYIDSNLNFLEIKFKNNKGRTIKDRISGEELSPELSDRARQFIMENSPYDPETLNGQITTIFNRVTLVNKKLSERITIDLDLNFHNHLLEKRFPNISIIEVKQDKAEKNSLLKEKLRERKIMPNSFSKYCFGTVVTNNKVKTNNFKPGILKLNKI